MMSPGIVTECETVRLGLRLTTIDRATMPLRYAVPFKRDEDYRGPHRDSDERSVLEAQAQALDYFGHTDGIKLPAPPLGFPAYNDWTYHEAMALLNLGASYYAAAVTGRPGRQWKLHHQAEQMLREAYAQGVDDVRAQIAAEAAAAEAEAAAKQAAKEAQWKIDAAAGRRRGKLSVVYFIAAEDGPIKIGVALNVRNRIKGLQTSHHEKLSVLATVKGNIHLEREYHARFAEHRIAGEWFARHPSILAEIERLGAGA